MTKLPHKNQGKGLLESTILREPVRDSRIAEGELTPLTCLYSILQRAPSLRCEGASLQLL